MNIFTAILGAISSSCKALAALLGIIHDNAERKAGMDEQKVADLNAQVKAANDHEIIEAGVRALPDAELDDELRRFSRPGDKR